MLPGEDHAGENILLGSIMGGVIGEGLPSVQVGIGNPTLASNPVTASATHRSGT